MFTLKTLGAPELRDGQGRVVQALASQPRRLALVIHLAVANAGRAHRRDKLIALFWPEWRDERARNALNQAVHFLRRSLGPDAVISNGDEVALSADTIRCDVQAFERALSVGEPEQAVQLYGGDFLDGFHIDESVEFDQWASAERERLRARLRAALEHLAYNSALAGDHERRVAWLNRLVALDPLSGRATRQLAESLAATGEKELAIRALLAHASRVEQELGTAPEPDLARLLTALRTNGQTAHAVNGESTLAAAAHVHAHASTPAATHETVGARSQGWRRWLGAAVLLALSLTLLKSSAVPSVVKPVTAFVVAPFTNNTADPAVDELSRLTTAAIVEGIEQARLGNVIRPEGAGRTGDTPRGQERSGAGIVISGAFHRTGDSVRVHAYVQRSNGRVIREFATADMVATQLPERIKQQVVGTLAAFNDPRLATLMAAGIHAPQYDAYRAFVAGLDLIARDNLPAAAAQFTAAAALDSSFVQAVFQLASIDAPADTQLQRVQRHAQQLTEFEKAELDRLVALQNGDRIETLAAARRAVTLAPHVPDAQFHLAEAALNGGYLDVAYRAIRQLEREPGWLADAEAFYRFAAEVYHARGDFTVELATANRARKRLGKESALFCFAGVQALSALGRKAALDSALAVCAQTERAGSPGGLRPFVAAAREARAHKHPELALEVARSGVAWYTSAVNQPADRAISASSQLANILAEAGDTQRAYAVMQQVFPSDVRASLRPEQRILFGIAAARAGDRVTALAIADQFARVAPTNDRLGEVNVRRAQLAAALGDPDEAIRLLRLAVSDGFPAYLLHRSIVLNTLVGYPPFDELRRFKQ